MQYLLDTVTVVRHFTGAQNLGNEADKILNKSDNTFVISVISLMEILYLSEKNRIKIDLTDAITKIETSSFYSIVDLTSDILKVAKDLEFYELHDRLILSTAKWLDIPILSCDKKFLNLKDIQVIWD